MIVVVSHAADDHATRVLDELARAGHPAVLVDTADFPQAMTVRQRFGRGAPRLELAAGGVHVDLADVGAVWWRRPQPFALHPGLDPEVATFAWSECREALDGMWAAARATWVNDPLRDEAAHHKPFQLAVATEVGLPVPRTLVTNDPDAARAFADDVGPGRTVYKTFLATEAHWRETRVLREDERGMLDTVRLAPVIFQELVPARADVRVTAVGDELFAAEVTKAPGAYPVDYRVDLDGATFRPTALADDVAAKVRALLQRLGLRYGAVDLLRTDDGDVFLEVNPAGEFLFVEDKCGLPLAAALAAYLTALDAEAA